MKIIKRTALGIAIVFALLFIAGTIGAIVDPPGDSKPTPTPSITKTVSPTHTAKARPTPTPTDEPSTRHGGGYHHRHVYVCVGHGIFRVCT